MADVRPFRGIRYNQEAIGDLALVVAPPFDVIGPKSRDSYYTRHPYNVIRLILNRSKKNDRDSEEPYRRASEFFTRWRAQRILIQDKEPNIYLYRQRYIMEGQYRECTGMVARVRLQDFSEGEILPHEEILTRPLEDRTKLLEHTRANFSLVEGLYSDPAEKFRDPLLKEMGKFPIAQFQTDDGIGHDVWGVSDDGLITKITGLLKKKTLYIADGHHRYQTALNYSRALQESGKEIDEDDPRNFLMMMIVEMENPGLSLLPVHRVVVAAGALSTEHFVERLGRWFNVTDLRVPEGSRSGQVFQLVRELEKAGLGGRAFGVFMKDPERFLLISWKPELSPERIIEGDYSAAYKNLDATVLHRLVIEEALGNSPDQVSLESNLVFVKDPLEAVVRVDSGEGALALLMNPPRVEQVRTVADHRERMPQKSTYFHPKPCSGVVMNSITEW